MAQKSAKDANIALTEIFALNSKDFRVTIYFCEAKKALY